MLPAKDAKAAETFSQPTQPLPELELSFQRPAGLLISAASGIRRCTRHVNREESRANLDMEMLEYS